MMMMMMMISPNSLLPTLLILALYYLVCSHHHVVVKQNTRFEVHVISEVPDTPSPLKIHCKSSDNDLGLQLVKNGQDFHWSFKENFFGTTLYTCGFGWNAQIQSFDVYSSSFEKHCQRQEEPWLCVWAVRTDGFYLGNESTVYRIY
ncbi:hypothetical protein ACSBR1_029344 [Camellia fascicularis]